MAARLLDLARQGVADAAIADLLTREGYRSPRCGHVPVWTVRVIRQRHCVLRNTMAQPLHIPGWLTIAELARRLRISRNWIHRHIRNGTIAIARDPDAHRYLFPDTDDTIARFKELRAGKIHCLRFEQSLNK